MTYTTTLSSSCLVALLLCSSGSLAKEPMPIADVHVHYSHDSVELTPPERVIEIMREANLKLALVSSSDDNGTQLLSTLAPDLIIPGLRPYRRRGETGTWFNSEDNLQYVETLLQENRYATIGEFHLYGDTADLPIPRRIVELADAHNLVLHAHSDADAVERLLAQSPTIKVLWAHSGFDEPSDIADMLSRHERLWADLAFRSDVGSGGTLSKDWQALFASHPDRMMLGTDTYTPERMHFIPLHAAEARTWLEALPGELAEKVAWKNAHDLLMPVWQQNRLDGSSADTANTASTKESVAVAAMGNCVSAPTPTETVVNGNGLQVRIEALDAVVVSQPFSVRVMLCGDDLADVSVSLDAGMPAHGHGTNYTPEATLLRQTNTEHAVRFDGMVLHMPGAWEWRITIERGNEQQMLTYDFVID